MSAARRFFGREWTDGEKWAMGILATLVAAGAIAAITLMLKDSDVREQSETRTYVTEIRYRVDRATKTIEWGKTTDNLREAVRTAFDELNGLQRPANKDFEGMALVVLVDKLRGAVPPEKALDLVEAYDMAMAMAELEPVLCERHDIENSSAEDAYQQAFRAFAVPPDGLWPRFKSFRRWPDG